MDTRSPLMLLLALALATAGCLGAIDDLGAQSADGPVDDAEDTLEEITSTPLVQDHDHADLSQHGGSANMDLLDYHPLVDFPKQMGATGYGEVVVQDGLALVAALGQPGGFHLVDVSDPGNMEVLGRYETAGGGTYDVKFCEGTDYAVVGIQSSDASPQAVQDAAEGNDAAVLGFQLVDISDPTDPTFVDSYAVPPSGSHNVFCYTGVEDRILITSTSSNFLFDPTGQVGLLASEPVMTKVEITGVFDTQAGKEIVPLGQYRIFSEEPASFADQRSLNDIVYVHDMYVQEHPETGQHLLYVAHWEAGLRIVDVSEPTAPQEIGHFDEKGPAQYMNIHYVRPAPELIDGKHVSLVAPELLISEDSGYVRTVDTTDPTDPKVLGYWDLPGDIANTEQLLFSPHNLDIEDGRFYIGHYHAGAWAVDIGNRSLLEDPGTLGYYLPAGDDEHDLANATLYTDNAYFTEPTVPNVWAADVDDGVVFLSDISTGLYAVQPAWTDGAVNASATMDGS